MATNAPKSPKAADPAPAPAPAKTESKADPVLECHAMVRVDGGWQRFRFAIPESVAAPHVTYVSDIDTFGTHQNKLDHDLYLQRERG